MSTDPLSPERWQQVKSLFLTAVELDTGPRQAFLTSNCGDDQALREVVERMIVADGGSAKELDQPFLNSLTDSSWVGKRVGVYRVVEELGRGGMGAVFLARREDEFDQLVAIKIVKRGLDTEEMLRRFRTERQILARLDHPNIARLLDGGSTPDGLPYFVMEHVPGVAIDTYCANRDLNVADRIKLFRHVCSAVSYAHQHLAIHRDIKPSNILVTEDGSPKLLDFGIAKLLNPEADGPRTLTGYQMMTPEYASPEQIAGNENVTTTSDVYSLGVVLYELLTGQSPYSVETKRADELARAICETEPERPSRVGARTKVVPSSTNKLAQNARALRGDLDNILLMALRKQAARRYSSVEQFSEDLRRYLEGLPVIARADTFRYRAGKFITRNRTASIGTLLLVFTLIGGTLATWYQARVARAERALAQRRFGEVRQLANSVVFKYHDAIEPLPGSTKVREMLVKDALEYLDKLSQESADDRSLQRELALAYLKVGDVQGKIYTANLGNSTGALESYRKALKLFEALAQDPSDLEAQADLRNAYHTFAMPLAQSGDTQSRIYVNKALAISEQLVKAFPTNNFHQLMLARCEILQVDVVALPGAERLTTLQKALTIVEHLNQTSPRDTEILRTMAMVNQRLGDQYFRAGVAQHAQSPTDATNSLALAVKHHRQSEAAVDTLVALDPENNSHRRLAAIAATNLGEALLEAGDPATAVVEINRAIDYFKKNSVTDPANLNAKYELALSQQGLSKALLRKGSFAEAQKLYDEAGQLFDAVIRQDPKTREYLIATASFHHEAGDEFMAQKLFGNALDHYRAARKYLEQLAQLPPGSQTVIAPAYLKFGNYYYTLAQQAKSPSARKASCVDSQKAYQTAFELNPKLRKPDLEEKMNKCAAN
jgi:serine/threonine protein kinase